MHKLKIDLPEFEMAFDSGGEMTSHYPDIEAGEIIGVSGQECGLLESIYESYCDEQT